MHEHAIPLAEENLPRIREMMGEDAIRDAQRDALDFVRGDMPSPPDLAIVASADIGWFGMELVEYKEGYYKLIVTDNDTDASLGERYENYHDAFKAFYETALELAEHVSKEQGDEE